MKTLTSNDWLEVAHNDGTVTYFQKGKVKLFSHHKYGGLYIYMDSGGKLRNIDPKHNLEWALKHIAGRH